MAEGAPPDAPPILVPVDFSSHSEAALLWAADVARCFAAPVVVLHVVHDPVTATGYYLKATGASGKRPPLRTIEQAAEERMVEFLAALHQKHAALMTQVEVRHQLVVGIPATRILEVAENLGARLIVMGSQGRTGLAKLMLGSKAEQVVRLAKIPITIVKD